MNNVLVLQPCLDIVRCQEHLVAEDAASFGIDAAVALSELSPPIAELNRTYRHLIARRALTTLPLLKDWIGESANVFLRHDAVFVFAIHHQSQVGMANFVELRDATFVVDDTGRQQTLLKTGTLPNHSTVHAFVSGQLHSLADEAPGVDLQSWHPVLYRPDRGPHFLAAVTAGETSEDSSRDFRPVEFAARVLMTPGRTKVWCQVPQESLGEWTPLLVAEESR